MGGTVAFNCRHLSFEGKNMSTENWKPIMGHEGLRESDIPNILPLLRLKKKKRGIEMANQPVTPHPDQLIAPDALNARPISTQPFNNQRIDSSTHDIIAMPTGHTIAIPSELQSALKNAIAQDAHRILSQLPKQGEK
jgi:hypothetical protein